MFMTKLIEEKKKQDATVITREVLLKLKELCENKSRGPWSVDEDDCCQRIFSNCLQTIQNEDGSTTDFWGHPLQLAKCPKKSKEYAEYWFEKRDLDFILESSKWMLPIINELLKHYPE